MTDRARISIENASSFYLSGAVIELMYKNDIKGACTLKMVRGSRDIENRYCKSVASAKVFFRNYAKKQGVDIRARWKVTSTNKQKGVR